MWRVYGGVRSVCGGCMEGWGGCVNIRFYDIIVYLIIVFVLYNLMLFLIMMIMYIRPYPIMHHAPVGRVVSSGCVYP